MPNPAPKQPTNRISGLPSSSSDDRELVKRRHPEWMEHHVRWRWLLDSLEGGNRYRDAIYGTDALGVPIRNMVRHKREYPDPRETASGGISLTADSWESATNDDYELRRARTPIPTFVAEATDAHLGRIYRGEIEREGPDQLKAWWDDVDGRGTSIDVWMQDAVAAILLVTGQVDVLVDHPPPPKGEAINTQADVDRLGLSAAVATYILPENMVWWDLLPTGEYRECLVRECDEEKPDKYEFRHWTAMGSRLLDENGNVIAGTDTPHPYGRVPIVRCFARRKPRCRNVGQSRYEGIAERQREFYNRDSELILSDTTQAHPLLQGPEDYVQADGTIPIGPNWLLPKKKTMGQSGATYEGFDVVVFPKDGAESIRLNLDRIREDVDRDAHLTKPAGASGTTGKTVSQSGVSKRLDSQTANDVLGRIAGALQHAEQRIAELVLTVLADGKPSDADVEKTEVSYPREYDLFTADELSAAITEFQANLGASGAVPEVESKLLRRLLRLMLPGLEDDEYEEMEAAIDDAVRSSATMKEQADEATLAMMADPQMRTDAQANESEFGGGGKAAKPVPPKSGGKPKVK